MSRKSDTLDCSEDVTTQQCQYIRLIRWRVLITFYAGCCNYMQLWIVKLHTRNCSLENLKLSQCKMVNQKFGTCSALYVTLMVKSLIM